MSIVGTLLGVTMEHVACILADDICHFHDAHEGGEGAFFVDVGALADAHDVFVLGVLEGGRVHVQESIFVG